MSLYPLNELKRRLEDDSISLPKRLRLAKNVVNSHHFATTPKEKIVGDWLQMLMKSNRLNNKDIKDVLAWLDNTDDLTSELKLELIKVVSQYLHSNPLQNEDIPHIVSFLENNKISQQLSTQIDDYLFLTTTLLQHLRNDDGNSVVIIDKIFDNLIKYYRESKKKLEFIIKLLDGENLETIFSFLETESCNNLIRLCQNILFPITKKSFFASFLNNLIRKDNIDELIAQKGDNIQSVIKIMSAFFTFPKGRTSKEHKFLADFINIFVSCYRTESQLIFTFYIMVATALNMKQTYLTPAMQMPPIIFEENNDKIKRNLFLSMLEILHKNEVDINVKLTDTVGEKIGKVEIKKNLALFLQAVMVGQLKLEGKPDRTTLQIIKTALKLDPGMIEQNFNQKLTQLMTMKKSCGVLTAYVDTINCLLEILFKLSRGIDFISQILPNIKLNLEAYNVEQFELKQKVAEMEKSGQDCEKMKSKILTGDDIFPPDCVEMYGRLTSELMFRQNKDLLLSLQKEFEENCLMMLEEGFVSPSIIILAQFLSAILSSFLRHCKMADHTVPLPIVEDFWATYHNFENDCLKRFGECILKLSYNPPLVLSFLKLCQSFAQLKLLNIKYSNKKLIIPASDQSEVFDLSMLLPCLDGKQWMSLASKIEDDEAIVVMDNLLLAKIMALELLAGTNFDDNNLSIKSTKSYLIKDISSKSRIITFNDYYTKVLFANLEKAQCKQLTKFLIKTFLNNPEELFKMDGISNNKQLLQALVLECLRLITKSFENANSLSKAITKSDFDMASFVKDINVEEYFNNMTINVEDHEEMITNCLEILKQLQIYYLEENCQLTAIFVLLALKRCCQSKKLQRSIDCALQSIYELSPKYPDIFKLFPVEFIFSFTDQSLIDLLTLNIKTSYNLLIVKNVLELAVKKVKTDNEVIKSIVEILLLKHKSKSNISSISYFSDPVFQISCLILPLIAKGKKAITTSAFRSILADLQEKLNQAMLDSFKNIDFTDDNCISADNTVIIDDSMSNSINTLATLNAMGAYTLTLLKCCETTDAEELKNLNCLWSGLAFFVNNAIQSIQDTNSKTQHIESSIHLLNVTLRYIKKLETHEIFQKRDEIFQKIWQSIKMRLLMVLDGKQKKRRLTMNCLEEIGVTLKFLSELSSIECFSTFVGDLTALSSLKKPSIILKNDKVTNSQITSRKVSKYLLASCLKANIVGPKCISISKMMYRNCKNVKTWIYQHYEDIQAHGDSKVTAMTFNDDIDSMKVIEVEDAICDLLRIDLDMLSEVVLAAKKMSLDYKFLDAIFELQHLIHYILGRNAVGSRCEISWHGFFTLYEGCYAILNNLLLSREELLEDRWPCFMQCFKPLVLCLCERATLQDQLDKCVTDKLAETAHSIEKLTQSICKRKAHVSRISAYAVADLCCWLERTAPPKMVRQHLENSIALLIQASDSTYAMAFLKRALAGAAGSTTMSNMYTMYKRYRKYVGNA